MPSACPRSIAQPDLVNPVTGDELWFERLPDVDGPLVFRCRIPAGSPGVPMHFHRSIDERFEVLDGELSMSLGRGTHTLRPGQGLDVPRRTVHRFWNASEAPVMFRSTPTPGDDFHRFLRAVYGLGQSGRVKADGMPRSLTQMAVLRELSDLYFPGVPMVIQRPAFGLLSGLATLTGTRERLAVYWASANPAAGPTGAAT